MNANASAKATQDGFGAYANATAIGVAQVVSATTFGIGTAAVINSGTMAVHAHARASSVAGTSFVSAHALAIGVTQNFSGAFSGTEYATFVNNGSLSVVASATANSPFSASAWATAFGVIGTGTTSFFRGINYVNNGSFHVEADAQGDGAAWASAAGMVATGLIAGGTVANYANMSVTASASGGTFAFANARGIAVGAASFTGLISNTGSLYVRAITNNGSGNVFATGIVLASFGGGTIVNNSGTIYAGVSMDSGTTFYRGTAINTSWPFDAVEIDWMGSAHGTGFIYGNVLISTSDSVFVSNGKTCFNGVINQPYIAGLAGGTTTTTRAYPLTAPFLPNLDDGAGGIDPFVAGVAVGQLTVASNGTLVMVNDPAQGAAAAYVSNYTQSGSLVLEIRGTTPNGGQGGDNTVGKIVASVSANLGGSLEIVPYAGLYTDTSYAIVSAPKGGIAGTWGKPSDPSVLLDFTVSNSGTVTVDKKILNVDRIAFNAVPGLTKNEQHVGLGIEHSYSTSMTGPYADMIAKLFQVGSATEYANDLFQLSGVEYGQQALATLSSVRMLNDTVGTHLQLISGGGSDSVGQLIQGISPAAGGTGIGKGNVWVSAYGTNGHADASSNSGSRNDYQDHGIIGGVDFDMDPQTRIGFVAGQTSGQSRFREDSRNQGNFNAWHLGMYGRYDADPWYVEGVAAYAIYSNDMTRNIFINPSAASICCTFPFTQPSSIIAGTSRGSYDSHVLSLHGEAGWNWDTGSAVDLTPFLAVSWMRATSDPFTERGLSGANLHVSEASADSFATQLGIRLTTDWRISDHMLLSPVVRLAWEHEWDGTLWSVDESFAGAPPGGNFTVNGKGYSRDFAKLGVGLSAAISDRVDAVIGYQGRWSSDQKENSVMGHVNLHW